VSRSKISKPGIEEIGAIVMNEVSVCAPKATVFSAFCFVGIS
jgi:hypothetical protein